MTSDDDKRGAQLIRQVFDLPAESRRLFVAALLDADEDAALDRSLSAILADLEGGVPLPPTERTLIARLAALLPPRDGRAFLAERDQLIRGIVAAFAPPGSTTARAQWLHDRFERYATGADWRATRTAVLPPHRDPERAQLWRLAQFGALPRSRRLWEIIDGDGR